MDVAVQFLLRVNGLWAVVPITLQEKVFECSCVFLFKRHHHLVAQSKQHQLRDRDKNKWASTVSNDLSGIEQNKLAASIMLWCNLYGTWCQIRAGSSLHLHSHYDDFEQLQAQFERLAALSMILVTRAHEEVLELPPQGLLLLFFLLLLGLRAHQTSGTGGPTPK